MRAILLLALAGSLSAQIVNRTTISNLPNPAGPVKVGYTNTVWIITDGQTSVDCTTGGGSVTLECLYNGTSWIPVPSPGVGGTATTKYPIFGPTSNADFQYTQKYGQSFYTIDSVNPNTSSLTGPQPTLFNMFLQDNSTNMQTTFFSMFNDTHTSGTRGTAEGSEGDCFMRGTATITNCIGAAGFAEQDSGTVGNLISIAAGGSAITGGTATALISLLAGSPTQTGGTTSYARGIEIADQKGIGTIGNVALWIDAQTGTGARAIYVGGAGIVDLAASSYILHPTVAFGSLPSSPAAGESIYCTNCTTAATCNSGGSGHMAVYNGSAWTCQ